MFYESKVAFDNISNNLAIIRHDIDQHQAVGDYSLNKWGEGFFMHIFNFVYGYELEDANFETANAPCIDLVDKSRKLAYQITTTRTVEKIRNTLNALKKPKYQDYEIRIFYLLDKANPYDSTITKIKDEFGIEDISGYLFDYTDLLNEIKKLAPSKIIELNNQFFKKEESALIKRVEELAAELGVTKNAFQNFFRLLGEQNVPSCDYYHELCKIAEHYHNNLKELANFQSEDPEVKALLNQAEQVLEQGDFDKAEELINQAADKDLLATKKLEENAHKRKLSAAAAKAQNGKLKLMQIKYLEAKKYYEQAVNLDSENALYLNELGFLFHILSEHQKAIDYYQKSLIIFKKTLGEEHPYIATLLNNIGGIYNALPNYQQEAINYYQQALTINQKVLGDEHPAVATNLHNIGLAYYDLGEYEKAIIYYNQALAIDIKNKHPNIAGDFNGLGGVYKALGFHREAIYCHQLALDIDILFYGNEHPDVARDLYNLGWLYYTEGKYSEAELLFLRSLEIKEKILGENHQSTKMVRKNLADLQAAKNNVGNAETVQK